MLLSKAIHRGCNAALAARLLRALAGSGLAAVFVSAAASNDAPPPAAEDARSYVEFITEDEANCQTRDAQHLLVHSTHPSRTIRVWLDRYYQGVGTGDRSHSDLAPAGEPEPLGCSRNGDGRQEWRVVRAVFIN